MTGNNYLLDTNIISALFKVEEIIASKITEANEIYIPVIAIGELYYGAELTGDKSKYIIHIEDIKSSYPVLIVDEITVKQYGSIKAALRRKGKPIPENDIYIAALALQHNLAVATRDKHFKEIDGISIVEW